MVSGSYFSFLGKWLVWPNRSNQPFTTKGSKMEIIHLSLLFRLFTFFTLMTCLRFHSNIHIHTYMLFSNDLMFRRSKSEYKMYALVFLCEWLHVCMLSYTTETSSLSKWETLSDSLLETWKSKALVCFIPRCELITDRQTDACFNPEELTDLTDYNRFHSEHKQ